MVIDVEVFDEDAVVLIFASIADRDPNELHSIEVCLANLLALLWRVAADDIRAVINIQRWRIRSGRWLCESACNQRQRGEHACQERVLKSRRSCS